MKLSGPGRRLVSGLASTIRAPRLIRERQAVCCALGTMPETPGDRARRQPRLPVCSRGTTQLLTAMQESAVTRLIVESSAAVGDSYRHGRWGAAWVIRRVLAPVMADKELQEAAVGASPLDWTIVRPVKLTFGARSDRIRAAPDLPYTLFSKISRASVAEVMLEAATTSTWLRQAVTVAA
ncbi:MAG: hypothetical protein E4H38_01445 [Gemmatimonadales bacterium]|nr:MAG: hypothetical protein E4H38_01445 [Gemmatimonadales bacterium]